MQYRLNEAVGRPFNSTVNGAQMIASGLFDRHPKLQVLIVHMGGELPSVLGRLEFNWRLNYNGILNPLAGKPYKNDRRPSDYFKTNILVDCMGFNPIGLRAAVEMCGVDRVVFGSDYGPVPYGIKEHVQIVEDVLSSPAEREQLFWKTSNKIFRLGLSDTGLVTTAFYRRRPSRGLAYRARRNELFWRNMLRCLGAGKGLRETRSWPTGCRRNPQHRRRDHDEECRFRFGWNQRARCRDPAAREADKRCSRARGEPAIAWNG